MKKLLLIIAIIITCNACTDDTTNPTENTSTVTITPPAFNADAAYESIKTQVAFGPRVPGSAAQKKCAAYMQAALKQVTDSVYVQAVNVTQPVSGKVFPCINIIGEINPQAKTRILLLCHWDSRGMADADSNKANYNKPIDAADDGASGVAVLLEIARAIKTQKLDIGVDILLADVEDMGKTEYEQASISSFCLGTRYWAQNPHKPGYKANYGICLDMVGAKNAEFKLEQNSKNYAGDWQNKIWQAANTAGHGQYFINSDGGQITDDHMEIIQYAKIPCVDIINLPTITNTGFPMHWHTLNDNINVIDKNTLKAVGETLLRVIYQY
jgi:glutaminyl-peptide cyclotransferase